MNEQGWSKTLSLLLAGEDLTRDAAGWALREIMAGEATEAQIGAFMMALRAKGETVDELAGLVDVMLENAVLLNTGSDAVDIVGTGGDLVGTVNISSMASVVTAAAGVPVLKHGSRSASGKTGSSEMLEVLGIRLDLAPAQVAQVFHEAGITFFFAPVFHPAMRFVAPVRKQLGVPTTFNFLGPLANPAQPIATALGVSNPEIAPLMAQEMAQRGRAALVFRSLDGLDEISVTAPTQIWQVSNGQVTQSLVDRFVNPNITLEQLIGGDAKHNAAVAAALFAGDVGNNLAAIKEVVLLNSAAGIAAYQLAKDATMANVAIEDRLQAAFEVAKSALESGAAHKKLVQWSHATQNK
ncbi:MAG: anthranilate phosphoribosyltransferase [Actinomycetota bacterium]